MKKPCLRITYFHGNVVAAYYSLPRDSRAPSVRTRRADPGLVIDFAADDQPLGIEITEPERLTLEGFSAARAELGLEPVPEAELGPLLAA